MSLVLSMCEETHLAKTASVTTVDWEMQPYWAIILGRIRRFWGENNDSASQQFWQWELKFAEFTTRGASRKVSRGPGRR
jgi:hypothetical protein